jgi:hypothetical protein
MQMRDGAAEVFREEREQNIVAPRPQAHGDPVWPVRFQRRRIT